MFLRQVRPRRVRPRRVSPALEREPKRKRSWTGQWKENDLKYSGSCAKLSWTFSISSKCRLQMQPGDLATISWNLRKFRCLRSPNASHELSDTNNFYVWTQGTGKGVLHYSQRFSSFYWSSYSARTHDLHFIFCKKIEQRRSKIKFLFQWISGRLLWETIIVDMSFTTSSEKLIAHKRACLWADPRVLYDILHENQESMTTTFIILKDFQDLFKTTLLEESRSEAFSMTVCYSSFACKFDLSLHTFLGPWD